MFLVPSLDEWCQERITIHALVKQHLAHSRIRMKRQADKQRSERQFAMGDKVFLKLQPYVQSSVSPRAHQNLAFKYFGPYKIVKRIGPLAYKLLLPSSSSIHPVFHVSQLKKMVYDVSQVLPSLPTDVDLPRVPVKVMDRRMVSRGVNLVKQVLIQWSDWPVSLATWEDWESVQQRFPLAPAWGQVESQERGNVTPSGGPHRSTKPRKPNDRIVGDEWIN